MRKRAKEELRRFIHIYASNKSDASAALAWLDRQQKVPTLLECYAFIDGHELGREASEK